MLVHIRFMVLAQKHPSIQAVQTQMLLQLCLNPNIEYQVVINFTVLSPLRPRVMSHSLIADGSEAGWMFVVIVFKGQILLSGSKLSKSPKNP